MTDVHDSVVNRLVDRKLAVYLVEAGMNPEDAFQHMRRLREYRKEEEARTGNRGLGARAELQRQFEEVARQDYEETVAEARADIEEFPAEWLTIIW